MSGVRMLSKILLATALALLACDRDKDVAQSKKSDAAPATQSSIEPVSFPEDSGPLPQIDSARAMQYAKEIVKFGPRPLGSPAGHNRLHSRAVEPPFGHQPVGRQGWRHERCLHERADHSGRPDCHRFIR